MGNYCLMGIEFQFCKMKWVLEKNGGDDCMTMWMASMPMNCTFKDVKMINFVVYILPQLK